MLRDIVWEKKKQKQNQKKKKKRILSYPWLFSLPLPNNYLDIW